MTKLVLMFVCILIDLKCLGENQWLKARFGHSFSYIIQFVYYTNCILITELLNIFLILALASRPKYLLNGVTVLM